MHNIKKLFFEYYKRYETIFSTKMMFFYKNDDVLQKRVFWACNILSNILSLNYGNV